MTPSFIHRRVITDRLALVGETRSDVEAIADAYR
jgi:hypothetical protein